MQDLAVVARGEPDTDAINADATATDTATVTGAAVRRHESSAAR
ncbi:hypothetical protein ACFWSJ_15870 [Streptomyces niveus]